MNIFSQNQNQIHIRNAAPADAGRIAALIRQLSTGEDDPSPITEAYVLHYLSGADRSILLAERTGRGGTALGLLSYSVRADLFHAGNSILIEELVVDEAARGAGIGSALMAALLNRIAALGGKELCLAVMPDNEDAIRFYRRHGLTEEALFLERHF